jgi:cellulose biosynthesis protein BcsQ
MTMLAIYSNKGGVGKTAAAVNLSYLAARTGAKTLLCDLDPQCSATYYFRVKPKLRFGVKGFIKGGKQVYKSVKGTDYENLDLLPADFSLRNLDVTFSILIIPGAGGGLFSKVCGVEIISKPLAQSSKKHTIFRLVSAI